jgi:flagellar protein FliO/FliZ
MPLPRFRAALAEPSPIHRAFLFAGGLLLLFLVVQFVPSSDAPPPSAVESGVETARPQRDGYRLFSVGNLLAFALLAGGGAYALHLRKRAVGTGEGPALFEPVGQFQLAQGQQLRLIRCGGEVLLLGVTSGQITLLQTYPDDAFEDAPPSPPAAGFADLLRTRVVGSHA